MTEAPRILPNHQLKKLKLPTILRGYGKQARLCAAEGRDHVQFPARPVEPETIDRERRMIERRIKAADQGGKVPGDQEPRLRRDPEP